MKGSADHLIYMANQIAAFFESQKHESAVLGVADHIGAFWDPHMRRDIYAHLDAGGAGLKPLALEGLLVLRARPRKTIRRRLERQGGVPAAGGRGSDAG